jgi:mono/diheme cytochrome c family protein
MKSKMLTKLILCGTFMSILSFAGGKAPASTPALLEKGKAAYTTNCLSCHGEKGDGNGPAGAYLNPKPRNYATDKFKKGDKVEQIFESITKGLPGTMMVAYGHLSEEERWGMAYYVKQLQKAGKK